MVEEVQDAYIVKVEFKSGLYSGPVDRLMCTISRVLIIWWNLDKMQSINQRSSEVRSLVLLVPVCMCVSMHACVCFCVCESAWVVMYVYMCVGVHAMLCRGQRRTLCILSFYFLPSPLIRLFPWMQSWRPANPSDCPAFVTHNPGATGTYTIMSCTRVPLTHWVTSVVHYNFWTQRNSWNINTTSAIPGTCWLSSKTLAETDWRSPRSLPIP